MVTTDGGILLGRGRNAVLVVALRGAEFEDDRSIILRVGVPPVKGSLKVPNHPTWAEVPGVVGGDLITCFERVWREKPATMLALLKVLWPELGEVTLQDLAWSIKMESANNEGTNTLEAVVTLQSRRVT